MIRINLAPPRPRRGVHAPLTLPRVHLGIVFGVVGVVLAAGLGEYGRTLWREERQLTAEVETATRELGAFKATVGQAAKLKEQLADLRARLASIEVLARDQGRPLRLIDAFADAVPTDLWITGLEDKGAALRVTGSAYSSTAIANFMAALRASKRFRDVDITLSRHDAAKAPSLVDFEITCRFEG